MRAGLQDFAYILPHEHTQLTGTPLSLSHACRVTQLEADRLEETREDREAFRLDAACRGGAASARKERAHKAPGRAAALALSGCAASVQAVLVQTERTSLLAFRKDWQTRARWDTAALCPLVLEKLRHELLPLLRHLAGVHFHM